MEFMDTILTRQSCRDYAPEQIDQRQLGEILRAGCAAPIGRKKFETVQLTVIQDPALLELITQNAKKVLNDPDANPLYGAPTMILVSVKEQEGQIPPTGIANAACVVENMHLAATDLTAISLAMDNRMPLALFALEDPQNIYRVIMGEDIGTIIKEAI